MLRQGSGGNFITGLAWGAVIGFALMLAPVLWLGANGTVELHAFIAPGLHKLWLLTSKNLQGSIVPFVVVLIVYWVQLQKLGQLLKMGGPELVKVVRHEQLLDLCANLFFGIGVIWTAIGMRDALLYALGDPGLTATQGAFAVLQRMVDGGILLALSTTIVGGIGGYLMRAVKSIRLGGDLNEVYMHATQFPVEENLATLQRIEHLLEHASPIPEPLPERKAEQVHQ